MWLSNSYIYGSSYLVVAGITFLTRSTCVIMDARSRTCKSSDFIPRYEKINVTIWMSYGTLASASTTVWRQFYQNIFAGTLVALLYIRNTSQMLVDLHSVWVWDLLVTRQSWFENGNISSNSTELVFFVGLDSVLNRCTVGRQMPDTWTNLFERSFFGKFYCPTILRTYTDKTKSITIVNRSLPAFSDFCRLRSVLCWYASGTLASALPS